MPAAARVDGTRKLSPDQIELAQRLYDAGEHNVAQISGMLKVPRTAMYGHLNKRPRNGADTLQVTEVAATAAIARTSRSCPPRADTSRPLGPRPSINAPTSPSSGSVRTRTVPVT